MVFNKEVGSLLIKFNHLLHIEWEFKMNAHKVIESIRSDSDLSKDEFNYLFENLVPSIKFEIDLEVAPEFSDDEMTAQMQILKMPFPVCYFEIPNYGALLTFH